MRSSLLPLVALAGLILGPVTRATPAVVAVENVVQFDAPTPRAPVVGKAAEPVKTDVTKAVKAEKPAPGAATVEGPRAKFNPPAGAFVEKVTVTVAPPAAGDTVRYTLDGSEPSEKSPVYAKPLNFSSSTYLRTRVYPAKGSGPGPVTSQAYTLLDPDLAGFTSNLPLVILQSFGTEIEHDEKASVTARVIPPAANGRSTPAGPAEYDGLGVVNYRGFSSLRYVKRSYTVKLTDDSGSKNPTPLLGMPKDSDWILYAPYSDKTLVRNALAYDLGRQLGHWAPRTRFVELFVSEEDGRVSRKHYMGVFMLTEKIKRDKDRVNIKKLGPDDNAEPEITGGYIFKKDHDDRPRNVRPTEAGWGGSTGNRYGYPTGPGGFPANPRGFTGTSRLGWNIGATATVPGAKQSFIVNGNRVDVGPGGANGGGEIIQDRPGRRETVREGGGGNRGRVFSDGRQEYVSLTDYLMTRQNNQFFLVDPEPDEITAAQRRWLLNHLNTVEQVLQSPTFTDPQKGYAAYLDVDSFIDHHLMVEVSKNIDGFRFSTFYHKDRNGKIRMQPIWDYDLAFGNATGKQGYLSEYWYWPQLDDTQYTWFRRMFEDPDFGQRYVDRYFHLRANVLHPTNVMHRLDRFVTELAEARVRNFDRWPVLNREVWPNYYTGESYEDELNWMRNWMRRRLAWIDRQFVAPPAGAPGTNGAVALASAGGRILITTDGSDPRLPGGAISPKAVELAPGAAVPAGTVVARTHFTEQFTPRSGGAAQTLIRWSAPWRSKG